MRSKFTGLRGWGEPGILLGNSGSVAACSRKRGQLNYYKRPGEVIVSYLKTLISKEVLKTFHRFIMWYSDILIELFQVENTSSRRNDKFLNHLVKALNEIICRLAEISTRV